MRFKPRFHETNIDRIQFVGNDTIGQFYQAWTSVPSVTTYTMRVLHLRCCFMKRDSERHQTILYRFLYGMSVGGPRCVNRYMEDKHNIFR